MSGLYAICKEAYMKHNSHARIETRLFSRTGGGGSCRKCAVSQTPAIFEAYTLSSSKGKSNVLELELKVYSVCAELPYTRHLTRISIPARRHNAPNGGVKETNNLICSSKHKTVTFPNTSDYMYLRKRSKGTTTLAPVQVTLRTRLILRVARALERLLCSASHHCPHDSSLCVYLTTKGLEKHILCASLSLTLTTRCNKNKAS